MFSKIPERYLHIVRWILAVGWLGLIFSLFYDPISAGLTEPNQLLGPAAPSACGMFQGECRPLTPYPVGTRIFWGMVVPSAIVALLVFGHEFWRRICPLSFMSQIPRALGWQGKRIVKENSWLHRHHSLFQFGLLFIGLNVRLLLINSDRFLLGVFLLLIIAAAIAVGFRYDGKTWCNYFCPMAPVQMIYSQPSGLLGSQAHTAASRSITQSMCRTVDQTGGEKSVCVACQSPCMDIDAERSYWNGVHRLDRKVIYYGYLGLVIGFYLYFGLYSGNWNFIAENVWHETNQLATLLNPGFYASGKMIPIPKLMAVPLTLTLFSAATYGLGLCVERAYRRYCKRRKLRISRDQVTHRLFTLTTFLAFNLLFFLGVYPTLEWVPLLTQEVFGWAAGLISSLWLVKNWLRSAERFTRERDGNLLRRQLSKLAIDFSQFLDGRSLADLNPDELYTLAKILPGFTHQYRLQIYTGILQEVLEQGSENATTSLRMLETLRVEIGVNDNEHWTVLEQLRQENPSLFSRQRPSSKSESTAQRPKNQSRHSAFELTVQRSGLRSSASTSASTFEATVQRSDNRSLASSLEPKAPHSNQKGQRNSATLPAELTLYCSIDQVKAASTAQQLADSDESDSESTITRTTPKAQSTEEPTIKSHIDRATSTTDDTRGNRRSPPNWPGDSSSLG